MNGSANLSLYCDLQDFGKEFKNYHFYLCVTVCVLGTMFNVLNICVLTTKQMRCPTNLILTSLAVADVLVMLEYIPFAYFFDVDPRYFTYYYTYTFASLIIFHACFTQCFHFISCCITIILAVWRYIAVKFPQNNNKWCGENRTKTTILLTYLICPVICTPFYFSIRVNDRQFKIDDSNRILPSSGPLLLNVTYRNVTAHYVHYTDETLMKYLSFYLYGLIIKLVPCILLTVLSSLLIVKLLHAKERRKRLMNPVGAASTGKKKVNQRHLEKEKQADRTTRMLLAVLLLFLMVEFPQAIFGLLNHIMGEEFEKECYRPLGGLLDLVALTNSAINFLLYCAMSQKFREVFREIFCPCFKAGPGENNRKNKQWISMATLNTVV